MKLPPPLSLTLAIVPTVIAVALLQLAFSLFYWLPSRSIVIALQPSLDLIILIGSILIWSHFRKAVTSRFKATVVTGFSILLTTCVLLGIAEGVAQREFGYPFTLAYHVGKIQALFKMMREAQSLVVFVFYMAVLVLVIAAIVGAGAWSLRRICAVVGRGKRQRTALGVSFAAYAALASLILGHGGLTSARIVEQADEYVHRKERIKAEVKDIESAANTVTIMEAGENLRRPTIFVFVIESYGQILFENEKFASYRSFVDATEKSLRESGFSMRTKVYLSSTFGGSSWLANASLLCRLKVSTEKIYASLFKSKARCLPRQFNEAGYESVLAASNTTSIPDRYAALYPFDQFFPRDSFNYKGPRMSWSYMPDQFVVDYVDRHVLAKPSNKPKFLYYNFSSSHHPWSKIPPYLKDWNLIGDGSIYARIPAKEYPGNAFLGGKQYDEGFQSSIEYSMQTISGYLRTLPKDLDFVAIVLGDHQPRRPVAMMDIDPWTVPVHVITRDTGLLDNFAKLGYKPGLQGIADPNPPGLWKFGEHIIIVLNDMHQVEKSMPNIP